MPKAIYEKTVRQLMLDMFEEWQLQPGQVFTKTRALDWFASNYPKLQPGTIGAHLVLMATNNKSRLHHHPKSNGADDLLFRVAVGQFRRYEPGTDPAPIRELVEGDIAAEEGREPEDDEDDVDAAAGSTEFLLERDLQNYLARNLDTIESGLRLYEDGGLEFDAGGRRIDILALDRAGAFVVLELKVSKGYDRVVGQLLRYMNWVRTNLAESGQRVRGMIVCRTMSDDLQLACASIPDVELLEYKLSVTVSKVNATKLPVT